MNKIWKYPLKIVDTQIVNLPRGAKILSAVKQDGDIILYAAIDNQNPEGTDRIIRILGTDHPFPDYDNCVFISTVVIAPFVWHVFEKKEGE